MEYARLAGYPVPDVHEVRDDALVLERIPGRTMMGDLRTRPWRLHAHARLLAELHRLYIGSPTGAARCSTSTCIRSTCSCRQMGRS